MYYCKDCKQKFENYKIITERHGLDIPPYEQIACCPKCESSNFEEYIISHCRYCGARLKRRDGVYCNAECRKKGEILWRKERKRKKQLEQSPLNIIMKRLQEYNKEHNTSYSYGRFVSSILPRL